MSQPLLFKPFTNCKGKDIFEDNYHIGQINFNILTISKNQGVAKFSRTLTDKGIRTQGEFQFPWKRYIFNFATGQTGKLRFIVSTPELDYFFPQNIALGFKSTGGIQVSSYVPLPKWSSSIQQTFLRSEKYHIDRINSDWMHDITLTYDQKPYKLLFSQRSNLSRLESASSHKEFNFTSGDQSYYLKHYCQSPLYRQNGDFYKAQFFQRYDEQQVGMEIVVGANNFETGVSVGCKLQRENHKLKAKFDILNKSMALKLQGRLIDRFNNLDISRIKYTLTYDGSKKKQTPKLEALKNLHIGLKFDMIL